MRLEFTNITKSQAPPCNLRYPGPVGARAAKRVACAAGLAVALLAGPVSAAEPAHHQLIAGLGLTEAEAAKLTTHQLAMLHHIQGSSSLSEDQKRRRTKWVIEGTVPRFKFSF